MASDGGERHAAPVPSPAFPPLAESPPPTAKSRSLARLWVQVKKAAIPAMVTGVLGYGGGFVLPPTAVFDYFFRQNPNDLGGKWIGSAAGAIASLRITELGGRNLDATLEIDGKSYKLHGNRDSQVVLEGPVGPDHKLQVGLKRDVGIRFFEDSAFIRLVPDPDKTSAPFLLCLKDTLNINGVKDCKSIGAGTTIFSREKHDPR
jgi:hypothetical protein